MNKLYFKINNAEMCFNVKIIYFQISKFVHLATKRHITFYLCRDILLKVFNQNGRASTRKALSQVQKTGILYNKQRII